MAVEVRAERRRIPQNSGEWIPTDETSDSRVIVPRAQVVEARGGFELLAGEEIRIDRGAHGGGAVPVAVIVIAVGRRTRRVGEKARAPKPVVVEE